MTHLVNFGENLRKIRLKNNLSQDSLALIADMDRSYLGSVERGEHNLSLNNIHKLAEALGVSPAEFFDTAISPLP